VARRAEDLSRAPARRRATTPASADDDPVEGFIAGYLPYLLARASHLISGQFHEHLAAERVPVMQWRVMAALWDAPKSAREVAEIILQKQPTVSKLLERMQRQGLLDRVTDPDDRRRIVVSLTPQGRAVAGPLIKAARRHERAVLDPFGSANAAGLIDALQRLIDRNR
jgi:MarR family transcriptional regulator, organic hydroperoxide resistance regulator